MVSTKFTESQTLLLVNLIKDHYETLSAKFSGTISKADKIRAWNVIHNDFIASLQNDQCANDFAVDKLRKKWENLLTRLPAYIKTKKNHISSTGRGPFNVKEELECCWDIVGRDNPKYVKPSFGLSSTVKPAKILTNSESYIPQTSSQDDNQTESGSLLENVPSGRAKSKPSPSENTDGDSTCRDSLSTLLKHETKSREELQSLRVEYLKRKIEAQTAKRDYYIAKHIKLSEDSNLL